MTVNVSARNYQITLVNGATILDITDGLGDDSAFLAITDEPVTEEGLLKSSGTLQIRVPVGREDDFDPWLRDDIWKPGTVVQILVADKVGTLRRHPRSNLRIMAYPILNDGRMSVELGCLLTYKDSREADGDRSGVGFNQVKTLGQAIKSILGENSYNDIGLAVQGSKNAPLEKTQSSYVKQAGELAFSSAAALYQTSAGKIQARQLGFDGTRIFKHVVGVDCAASIELIGGELPIGKLTVVGTDEEVGDEGGDGTGGDDDDDERDDDAGRRVTYEYAPREAVEAGAGADIIRVATRIEEWGWENSSKFVRTIEETRVRGQLVSTELYEIYAKKTGSNLTYPSAFDTFPGLVSIETWTYESGGEGRLLEKRIESYSPKGSFLFEYYRRNMDTGTRPKFLDMDQSLIDVTTYEYKGGQTIKTTQKIYRPYGQVAGLANDWKNVFADETVPILAEENVTEWRRRGFNNWEQTIIEKRAGQISTGARAAFTALAKVREETIKSRAGNAQPPAAERKRPGSGSPVRTAYVTQQATSEYSIASERGRVLAIGVPINKSQAQTIAEMWGRLLNSRHRGFRVTTELRDQHFYYIPRSRIDVVHEGRIYHCACDLVQWVLADDRFVVVHDLNIYGYGSKVRATVGGS